jgi:SHS family lactate transporter-like MFS transporter
MLDSATSAPPRANWAAFFAAWFGWVLDAFDFTIYLLVMSHIAKEFDVSLTAVSGSITLTLLLRLGGASAAGWMADRWGRKLPLMLSLIWFAAFDAAIYFAPTFTAILVLRTLFGFGMGAEWTAGTALAMESLPARHRKIASGVLQAGWPVGFLLAAATAYFVVPAFGWRAMFLVAIVPAVLVFPIRFLVRDEAPPSRPKHAARTRGLGELGEPAVLRMLALGACVMALGFIVYYALTSQYTLMLITEMHLSQQTAFVHVIVFNLGMLVGVILAGVIASRRGVILALVLPALLMVPAIPLYVGWVDGLLGVGAFLGGALGVGYSGVTPVLTTSLFPAHVRARAIGVVYHAGALIAAFVPWTIAALHDYTGRPLSMIVATVVGVGLVAMAAAVIVLRRHIAPHDATTGELSNAGTPRPRPSPATDPANIALPEPPPECDAAWSAHGA